MTATLRIAMWSGPRNLSTTMMRSFAARSDTTVVDEPFYAPVLKITGLRHPMTDDILAAHEADPAKVIEAIAGPAPGGAPVFYQKHMIHHLVDGIPMNWLGRIERHVLLIRHPARVISSYQRKMETLSLEALGIPQQFDLSRRLGQVPVIDADRVLEDPAGVLARLCAALGIAFEDAMLSWPPGPRAQDGAWAAHWYDAVWASTGFGEPASALPRLSGEAARMEKEALATYERLLEWHV